jgi:DNA-binding LacI/PurR family transcriptional regulator
VSTSLAAVTGHRRIAHVTGDIRKTRERYWVLLERLEGYRCALERAGISYDESLGH